MGFPGAREEYPFGPEATVYKAANGKMFALCSETLEGLRVSLKLSPDEVLEALTLPFVSTAPYMSKTHWVAATVRGPVEWEAVQGWLTRSHELVTPKPRRAAGRAVS